MSAPDKKWWALATRARNKLDHLIGADPSVLSIDIGKDVLSASDKLVLRVRVRSNGILSLRVPDRVNGILVRVITDDAHSDGYTLEQ